MISDIYQRIQSVVFSSNDHAQTPPDHRYSRVSDYQFAKHCPLHTSDQQVNSYIKGTVVAILSHFPFYRLGSFLIPTHSLPSPSVRGFPSIFILIFQYKPLFPPTFSKRDTLTAFCPLLTSTLSNASRLTPAKCSNFSPQQDRPATPTSESTNNGQQHYVSPYEDANTNIIINAVPQKASSPAPPKPPAQQSAAAPAEKATVSATEILEVHQNSQGSSAGTVIAANPDPCGTPTGTGAGCGGEFVDVL